jgi:hypothetical protein
MADLVWDNRETGELVQRIFSAGQWRKAHPSVRSMTDRPEFGRYHYHQALDMMHDYIKTTLNDRGIFGAYEDYNEFSYLMLKIRANIIAFIQSLHAIPDTCGHMLFYCLALDKLPGAPKERDVTARSVSKMLEREREKDHPEYARLCNLFSALTLGGDFKHLDALANTAKHRNIIRPSMNEDMTGTMTEKHYLKLESFRYGGSHYKEVNARDFMQSEHDRIQPLIVDIGAELNTILRSRLTSRQP